MVRVYLEDRGYKVIEHQGGEYDSSLLFKCRHMIMVGIDRPSDTRDGIVTVGKGQYNQLRDRKNRGLDGNMCFSHTMNFTDGEEPVFRSVITNGVVDEDNWTTNYGTLRCKMSSYRRMSRIASHAIDGGEDMMKQADTSVVLRNTHLACIILFK
jgi:hypothetical protein